MFWIAPLLLSAGPVFPAEPPLVETIHAAEVRTEASYILRIADDVSRVYVRPVTRKELLLAALIGWHEEVRLAMPATLEDELGEATDATAVIELLVRVREQLGEAENLRAGNGMRVAVQAMCRALDPYCAVITSDDLRRGQGEDLNVGLGFTWEVLGSPTDPVRVKTVVLGGPAQRAGLRPGDHIVEVRPANVEVAFADLDKALSASDQFTVKFRRSGDGEEKVASLAKERYRPETVLGVRRLSGGDWDYWLDADRKIAQIRIAALDHGVAEDLFLVLSRLKEAGLRGVVLDLRWSPGGFLNQAIWVSRLFLPEGVIVARTRSRNDMTGQWEEQDFPCPQAGPFQDLPLVVLVNGETSGGAELIAAALQDHKRALVVGQRTFGKGSIQTQKPLPAANAGLKVTSGNFLRPSGKALHRFPDSKPEDDWGVRPQAEHETPVSKDLSLQLRDWWLQLSLRPGGSDELLTLDDPDNDPQRSAAVRVLTPLLR